nr:MAG TPA: hypothetical protein [Caudoviricetes sp.]
MRIALIKVRWCEKSCLFFNQCVFVMLVLTYLRLFCKN